MSHDHHHNHHHGQGHSAGEADLAQLLDLDAEVLHEYLSEVTTWVFDHTTEPPRRIVDIGSGTGTGTVALARLADQADVIALDTSPEFLGRVAARAESLGLAHRITTVEADLDAAWPTLEPVDLVWASMSMHHMADPHRVLTDIRGTIRPGGLLAIAEMRASPRFLPDDIGLGRPGLEARVHALRAGTDQPDLGLDWTTLLQQAGFDIVGERTWDINVTNPDVGRYAHLFLSRHRGSLDGRLDADDLATLDTLLGSDGPEGLLRRTDLVVRTARTVWLARRP